MGGFIFGGAYFRSESSVSKSARLIIGGKFVSAKIFQCANDNINNLILLNIPTSNTTALNFIEDGILYINGIVSE